MEAVRGILEQLFQARTIIDGVARQFPGVADQAEVAGNAIDDMAQNVLVTAQTGSRQRTPPGTMG